MNPLPRCEICPAIEREAGVRATCYPLRGNQPAAWRRGLMFTVDPSFRASDGALSPVAIPCERLRPGPTGKLFAVDATDCVSSLGRCVADLDRPGPDGFTFDQGDPETHCRNAYFAAMSTYETFRRALGRPIAWAFWTGDTHPPLRLAPFALEGLNAYYDRDRAEIGFGFGRAGEASARGDRDLLRFTALSSDVVAHEVTHALLDGLRPDYAMPVNPDVFAFHEALADVVALLSRFERSAYFGFLARRAQLDFREAGTLVSLAPEIGQIVRESGLRTLDVDWTTAERAAPGTRLPLYRDADSRPHERGGLLSSAILEAFLRAVGRRIEPLVMLAAPSGSAVARYLLEQVEEIAATTARHFLSICIRAIDYCPPAAILFSDYLRALVTADRLLAPDDRFGYREELVDAFRRRGIYPEEIDVISESELAWDVPEIPVYPIPGLSLSSLRYHRSPVIPPSAAEIRRRALALALAIDADPRLYRELGLRDPRIARTGEHISAPVITSVRPALRTGPDGYIDFSIIAEIAQDRDIAVDGRGHVRHRGGATLILDAAGTPTLIVSQRIDSEKRLQAEVEYARRAIAERWLTLEGDRYVVDRSRRRNLCAGA